MMPFTLSAATACSGQATERLPCPDVSCFCALSGWSHAHPCACSWLTPPLTGPCCRPSLNEINTRQGLDISVCLCVHCFLGRLPAIIRPLVHILARRPLLGFSSPSQGSLSFSTLAFRCLRTCLSLNQLQSLFPGSTAYLLQWN